MAIGSISKTVQGHIPYPWGQFVHQIHNKTGVSRDKAGSGLAEVAVRSRRRVF